MQTVRSNTLSKR